MMFLKLAVQKKASLIIEDEHICPKVVVLNVANLKVVGLNVVKPNYVGPKVVLG